MLQERIDMLESRVDTLVKTNRDITEKTIPATIKRVKAEERAAGDKRVEKVKAEMEIIRRGLEQEQVQKRAHRKAAEEREQQLLKDIQGIKK